MGKVTRMILPQAAKSSLVNSSSYFDEYRRVLTELPHREIERVVDVLHEAYKLERRIFLFGNGGSASLASHFACDLGKGTCEAGISSKRFRVMSLTDNLPLLTAWANDTSYEQVFAEQLRNFVQEGDIAFGISGSGCSRNVLAALEVGRQAGAMTIGLTGFMGGKMPEVCDLCIIIPSNNMQIIEDLQLSIAHALFTVIRHRITQGISAQANIAGIAA